MTDNTILVTGGAGFIGSNLCKYLLELDRKVICMDDFSTGKEANIAQLKANPNFSVVNWDITKPLTVSTKISQIYHLACPASPLHYGKDPLRTIHTNYMGTLNVLELAKAKGARVLLASTSETYGEPLEHPQKETYRGNVNTLGPRACYDEGKRIAETLVYEYNRQHGVEARIVRIFNTYGPNLSSDDGRVVSNFVSQALKDEPITIYGDGLQTRCFCYVDDLVDGLVRLMNYNEWETTCPREALRLGSFGYRAPARTKCCDWDPKDPEPSASYTSLRSAVMTVNLGNDQEFTVQELADLVIRLTDSRSKIIYVDLPIDDPSRRKPDLGKAKELLNWQPTTPLITGLTKFLYSIKR